MGGTVVAQYSATVSATRMARLPSINRTSSRKPRGCSVRGCPTSSGLRSQASARAVYLHGRTMRLPSRRRGSHRRASRFGFSGVSASISSDSSGCSRACISSAI
ncbi:hypothetical protein ES703_124006 [subsurface metagenome]